MKNSYRYREYRYDTETGLYYLQSRYYNTEWGRFINADGIAANTGELLSANMFAYCKNNPVSMHDYNGDRPDYGDGTGHEKEEERHDSIKQMYKLIDVTQDVNAILKGNGKLAKKYGLTHTLFQAGKWFASKVKTGGPWDLKTQPRWKYKNMVYYGVRVDGPDIGNINYGYCGSKAGFDNLTLRVAAGVYQVKSRTSTIRWIFSDSFGDDPDDANWTKFGMALSNYGF